MSQADDYEEAHLSFYGFFIFLFRDYYIFVVSFGFVQKLIIHRVVRENYCRNTIFQGFKKLVYGILGVIVEGIVRGDYINAAKLSAFELYVEFA